MLETLSVPTLMDSLLHGKFCVLLNSKRLFLNQVSFSLAGYILGSNTCTTCLTPSNNKYSLGGRATACTNCQSPDLTCNYQTGDATTWLVHRFLSEAKPSLTSSLYAVTQEVESLLQTPKHIQWLFALHALETSTTMFLPELVPLVV